MNGFVVLFAGAGVLPKNDVVGWVVLLADVATFPNEKAAGFGVPVLPKIEAVEFAVLVLPNFDVAGCNVATEPPDVLPKNEVVDWPVGAAVEITDLFPVGKPPASSGKLNVSY